MRKKDQNKSSFFEKAAKTINFDKIVLQQLEEKCRKAGTTVSAFVNNQMRRIAMTDAEFYRAMAKEHAVQSYRYKLMADEMTAQATIQGE